MKRNRPLRKEIAKENPDKVVIFGRVLNIKLAKPLFRRYNFKIKSFTSSTITFDNKRIIRKSDIAINYKNVKTLLVTGDQSKKLTSSAFDKVPTKTHSVKMPHPSRKPGDIANFQPQHTSLSSLNPTLTPADTSEFDFVPHHFSVDSFPK